MGRVVLTPCCLKWGQTMVEVMKIMATSFKRSHAGTAALSAPDPAADHRQPTPLLQTPGHSWTSLAQSLVASLILSPVFWCTQGNLLQEGLCHTQVCCTQSPCPCGRPLMTHTSTGDTQTQFWLSLCGVSGSWCAQGLFEPSKCLWWVSVWF